MKQFRAALLLLMALAMVSLGTVPKGMMRVGDQNGSRLVICSADGPTEIWAADREPIEEETDDSRAPARCVHVQLTSIVTTSPALLRRDLQLRQAVLVQSWHQIAARVPSATQLRPRAPPAFV